VPERQCRASLHSSTQIKGHVGTLNLKRDHADQKIRKGRRRPLKPSRSSSEFARPLAKTRKFGSSSRAEHWVIPVSPSSCSRGERKRTSWPPRCRKTHALPVRCRQTASQIRIPGQPCLPIDTSVCQKPPTRKSVSSHRAAIDKMDPGSCPTSVSCKIADPHNDFSLGVSGVGSHSTRQRRRNTEADRLQE